MNETRNSAIDNLRDSLEQQLEENVNHAFIKYSESEHTARYSDSVTELTAGLSEVKGLENINSGFSKALSGEVISQVINDLIAKLRSECARITFPQYLNDFPNFEVIDQHSEEIKNLLIQDRERLWYTPTTLSMLQCVADSNYYVRDENGFKGPLALMKVGSIKHDEDSRSTEAYCFIYPHDSGVMVVAFDTDDILLEGFTISSTDDDIQITVKMLYNPVNIIIVVGGNHE